MSNEEKINFMRIAAGICGFRFENHHLDLLVSLYELTLRKQGKTTMDEIVNVEFSVNKREEERKKCELAKEHGKVQATPNNNK